MCVCMGRVELKVQSPYLLLSLFQRINESKEKESPFSKKKKNKKLLKLTLYIKCERMTELQFFSGGAF